MTSSNRRTLQLATTYRQEKFTVFLSVLSILIIVPKLTTAEMDQFTKNSNSFAFQLYKHVASGADKNVILSPFSISTCLSLVAMGATGKTAEEIFSTLKYNGLAKDGVAENYKKILGTLNDSKSLKIANKVYIQQKYSLKPQFKELAINHFYSEAELLDFAKNVESANAINNWVEQKTNNKIRDLIKADLLNEYTRMVLVNAIHFKGTWLYQFDKDRTHPLPFWISATESVNVPTMSIKKHFNYGMIEELDSAVLEMTYRDSDVSMLIILPNKRDGLTELEKKLESFDLDNILSKMGREEVEVFLPKFKIEFEFDLGDTLKELGMSRMFSDQAEFGDMLEQGEDLKVSKVIHKAFIEVNEEGAEAAAATAAVISTFCLVFTTQFIADHPFFFAIVDPNRKVTLFGGKFVK